MVALNMASHNFVKVADNWIKICNSRVKFGLKIPNRLRNMSEKLRRIFLTHTILLTSTIHLEHSVQSLSETFSIFSSHTTAINHFHCCTNSDSHRSLQLQCESEKNPPWGLLAIFPKWLKIFRPNFTRLLRVPIYGRLRIFTQLSPTLMKLCHIKCDHPACVSVDGGHFEHIMGVALNMA